LALGNMVYFAHDLGFTVKTTKEENFDDGRIALRIENQLQSLREVYRQQSVNDASLVGGMMLQFDIGRSGEVAQVKDVSSTITDLDFRRSVVGEVAKWSFNDIVSEPMSVSCPLLFVQEGMDITTLVQWEKALGHFAGKGTPVRVMAGAKQQPKQSETPSPTTGATKSVSTPAENPAQVKNVKAESKIFQIKYPTSLRKDPNFSSTSLMTFTIGTKVVLINGRGDWLEVKAIDNNLSGFIRKEFVTPFDVVRK
ncbi:MAG: AgmX/PglI C-terminal domain-containing protein, partial [Candidatus Binatia bacterium]